MPSPSEHGVSRASEAILKLIKLTVVNADPFEDELLTKDDSIWNRYKFALDPSFRTLAEYNGSTGEGCRRLSPEHSRVNTNACGKHGLGR